MNEAPHVGIRLTTTCTTGWTNPFHGELWLFQDGILRVPLGWLKSICCVGYVAELFNPQESAFSAEAFSRLISHPRHLWIPREAFTSATLRFSLRAIDLRAQLWDDRSLQLLTIQRRSIYLALESALHEWLGEAFVPSAPWWLRR